jgi:hypothetical protein
MATTRIHLRIIALIPLLFGIFGLALLATSIQLRHYWAPAPGILIASTVVISAALAIYLLWRAARSATAVVATAGVCCFGALYAVPRLFPLVNASDEPPSFFLFHGFSIALLAVGILTVAAAWLTHRALRRAA